MAKSIGELSKRLVEQVAARRESIDRWFMDREGNVHLNIKSVRQKPVTDDEWAAINEAVRNFACSSTELH